MCPRAKLPVLTEQTRQTKLPVRTEPTARTRRTAPTELPARTQPTAPAKQAPKAKPAAPDKMERMATFTVRGQARREVNPERAKALLAVEVTGAHRGEVWDQARAAHNDLANQAVALVNAKKAVDWTALEVQVGSYYEWMPMRDNPGQSEQVRKYRASGDITVEFKDFTELGLWLAAVAELPNVEVRGVSWSLTEATKTNLHRKIRHDAVQDARQRADDYAADFGLANPSLTALFESGLYNGGDQGGGGGHPVMPRALMMAEATAAEPNVELKPAIIQVAADIVAVFAARH